MLQMKNSPKYSDDKLSETPRHADRNAGREALSSPSSSLTGRHQPLKMPPRHAQGAANTGASLLWPWHTLSRFAASARLMGPSWSLKLSRDSLRLLFLGFPARTPCSLHPQDGPGGSAIDFLCTRQRGRLSSGLGADPPPSATRWGDGVEGRARARSVRPPGCSLTSTHSVSACPRVCVSSCPRDLVSSCRRVLGDGGVSLPLPITFA